VSEGASGLLAGAELRRLNEEVERLRLALTEMIGQLDRWAAASVTGGWSTHQVDPMRREADRLRKVLLP